MTHWANLGENSPNLVTLVVSYAGNVIFAQIDFFELFLVTNTIKQSLFEYVCTYVQP
jgi:hypothetical protein